MDCGGTRISLNSKVPPEEHKFRPQEHSQGDQNIRQELQVSVLATYVKRVLKL